MKTHKFEVPFYKVQVTLVQIEGPEDMAEVEKACKKFGIEVTPGMRENIMRNRKNGGDTYRLLTHRCIVVFFYPFTNPLEREGVMCHEKRHIEDRILEFFGVSDIESSAFLAGYLGEEFYKFKEKL